MKANKMYENGPKIVKGEDGKPKVSRGEKEAVVKNAGDEAEKVPAHDSKLVELMHSHAKERLAMNQKHDMELMEHTQSKGQEAMDEETSQVKTEKADGKETKPKSKE